MGLGIMSEQADFQTHGWTVLMHVVATPTPQGSKVWLAILLHVLVPGLM